MSRSFTSTVRPFALLLLWLGTPLALAQIGQPPDALMTAAALQPQPDAEDGRGAARTELGTDLVLEARGGALARVAGEGLFDEATIADVARVVAAATGYFDAIEGPVRDFLRGNLAGIAGAGPRSIGVDRFALSLDVSGEAAPYRVAWSIALVEVPEGAFLPVRHGRGPADARYVIREFSDLQCPFCARFHAEVMPALEATLLTRDDVRYEYHHLVLGSRFANSGRAAEATECVADANPDEPDAFWRYLDTLFERQQAWSVLGDPDPYFARVPAEIGLSGEGVAACLAAGTHTAAVAASTRRAFELGVSGTPTVFVGPFKLADFSRLEAYLEAMALIDAFRAEE
jgi:protein-disulfide isomerase